jgi:hypothetical protein
MPNDYLCKSCSLVFSTGWYHLTAGASVTLLACSGCGTCYSIFHAPDQDCPDTLQAQPEPATGLEDGSGLYWSSLKEWQPFEVDGTPMPAKEEGSLSHCQSNTDPLGISQVTCHYCKLKGSLLANWLADNEHCPRCHGNSLVCQAEWMT